MKKILCWLEKSTQSDEKDVCDTKKNKTIGNFILLILCLTCTWQNIAGLAW